MEEYMILARKWEESCWSLPTSFTERKLKVQDLVFF